ncbi:hypothetical protein AYI68_g3233 [Smittium mucronatum]|uniref:Uncharacterized protein n=1 Tax=Smittium mucronatum TaxID=133383 RepID=A0A1R0H0I2_9FUNG|nr:hypothetical protein AYI68_g3233 [Smittium mucronatum]
MGLGNFFKSLFCIPTDDHSAPILRGAQPLPYSSTRTVKSPSTHRSLQHSVNFQDSSRPTSVVEYRSKADTISVKSIRELELTDEDDASEISQESYKPLGGLNNFTLEILNEQIDFSKSVINEIPLNILSNVESDIDVGQYSGKPRSLLTVKSKKTVNSGPVYPSSNRAISHKSQTVKKKDRTIQSVERVFSKGKSKSKNPSKVPSVKSRNETFEKSNGQEDNSAGFELNFVAAPGRQLLSKESFSFGPDFSDFTVDDQILKDLEIPSDTPDIADIPPDVPEKDFANLLVDKNINDVGLDVPPPRPPKELTVKNSVDQNATLEVNEYSNRRSNYTSPFVSSLNGFDSLNYIDFDQSFLLESNSSILPKLNTHDINRNNADPENKPTDSPKLPESPHNRSKSLAYRSKDSLKNASNDAEPTNRSNSADVNTLMRSGRMNESDDFILDVMFL